MRFIHAVHSCDPAGGGVAEAVVRLSGALHDLGHDSCVLSCDPPGAPFLRNLGFPATGCGPAAPGSYAKCSELGHHLREESVPGTVLVAHGLWQYPGHAVMDAATSAGIPYLVYPHGMLDPWFRRTYPLKHLKKTLYWKFRQARILAEAQAVCFTTEEERRLARDTFRPYRCNEVVTGLGVDEPPGESSSRRAAFFSRFPELRDSPFLLFLARIHPKKGADLLLQAFAELISSDLGEKTNQARIVLAGPEEDPTHVAELRRLASPLGDRVLWTGMLEGDLKWGALDAADALILPSHQENFGMVVAEALAVGVPVLISDKVNLWREVVEDRSGLVASDDLPGVRQLLEGWLSPSFADLRPNARPCFERRFHIRSAAHNLANAVAEPS